MLYHVATYLRVLMAVEALSDLVLINVTEGRHLRMNMGQQVRGWWWLEDKDVIGLWSQGEEERPYLAPAGLGQAAV